MKHTNAFVYVFILLFFCCSVIALYGNPNSLESSLLNCQLGPSAHAEVGKLHYLYQHEPMKVPADFEVILPPCNRIIAATGL